MSDEKPELKDALQLAVGLADALSIKEASTPIMQEVGKAGSTILGLLNSLLSPVYILN